MRCHSLKLAWNSSLRLSLFLFIYFTNDHKLTFRSASIQSTSNGLNQVTPYFIFFLIISLTWMCVTIQKKMFPLSLHCDFKCQWIADWKMHFKKSNSAIYSSTCCWLASVKKKKNNMWKSFWSQVTKLPFPVAAFPSSL